MNSAAPPPLIDESRFQAFARKGLLARAAPFLGAMALAIAVYPLPPHGGDPSPFFLALVLNALIVIATIGMPWQRLPHFAQMAPPFAFFVVIVLLREADGGGASAYPVLAMLPVFWLALYGTRRQLAVSIVGVAAIFLMPLLLVGSPDYPSSEWTRAILWICVAPIVGFTVQRLVRELRLRVADAARQTEKLLASQEEAHQLVVNMAAVTEATREISRTTDAEVLRHVICSAACNITRGRFATLMEPDGAGGLVMTANHGLQGAPPIRLEIDGEPSGAAIAFRTAKMFFVDDARTDPRVSERLRKATGAVSIRFEPAIRMLAAETAMMLERSVLLARLEASARTDDLTGLLNRRAWEEQLPREMARSRRNSTALCVAMLDLDLFKSYNDDRGHQAGDRLLKQSAAAWAGELRASDTLARYGGEEFTVALPGCTLADARVIVERLRAAMPAEQKVSAGVACWNGRESSEELVGRADAALYEAKRTGRDRLVSSGDSSEPEPELRSVGR